MQFAVILQYLLGIPDTLGTHSATLSPSDLRVEIMVDATDRAFVGNQQFGMGYEPTYSGANSLFRRQYSRELDGVDIVAWGVPYDLSVTNRPGRLTNKNAVPLSRSGSKSALHRFV